MNHHQTSLQYGLKDLLTDGREVLALVGQRHEVLLPDLVRVERDAAAGRIEQRLEVTSVRI